jgi:hypothetical protein
MIYSDRRTTRTTYGYRVARRWLLPRMQLATVLLLMLALPVAAKPVAALRANPAVHVYLMRGVLNIFSLGLDGIANQLQQQGINATVHNHLVWSSISDEAAADYKAGRINTIILVGHSSGATVLPDMVARLDQLGAPVKLAIGLDSVFRTSLSGRVGRYINFYVANGAGTAVQKTSTLHGTLENVDVEKMGVGHLSIDKDRAMQQRIISAIDAVAFARPARPKTATSATVSPAGATSN